MKPLAPNTLIQNRYLIVQLIGKGGMGDVYLAVDQRLGSAIALKRTFFADDEMLGGAFEREAKILARLRHPVLPKVSDHFTDNDQQFLVMEHISGDDLFKRLEMANKPFPLSWVLFWADQLLDALSYLHTNEPPILHRDIKPQNLKLTDENHIVLLDFGLSKNSAGETQFTNSGSVVGFTPHYAPMEQIRGMGTSPRSDIYGLSATLYQLMTNVVPADALTRADALLNGSPDPLRPVSEINPEIQPVVSDVIIKGMEVSQERRYESAREMQKALRDAFAEMQSAMAAKTVAFTVPEGVVPESAAPTEVIPQEALPTAEDMDATLHYDAALVAATPPSPLDTPSNAPGKPDDDDEFLTVESSKAGGQGFDPYATMMSEPVKPEETAPEVPARPDEPAPEVIAETEPEPVEEKARAASATPHAVAAVPPVTPAAAAPKGPAGEKKSKKGLVVGVLVVLFLLVAGAAAGGYFVYQKYYAAPEATPTPSPSPTPTATPAASPSPTAEMPAGTNTNSGVTTVPTPEPGVTPPATTETPRATPKVTQSKTPPPVKTPPPSSKPPVDRLKTEQ